MKQLLFILTIAVLGSCTKKWECTITTVADSPGYSDTSVKTVQFEGSKEEAKNYEQSGTKTTNLYPEGTIKQTTVCK